MDNPAIEVTEHVFLPKLREKGESGAFFERVSRKVRQLLASKLIAQRPHSRRAEPQPPIGEREGVQIPTARRSRTCVGRWSGWVLSQSVPLFASGRFRICRSR